ncbi:MAG: quinolinate synthase NadA [Verrucomicrobia bacterium]|nr:quinolinate synthase NadA [Verrucomicrobiota bacterium]
MTTTASQLFERLKNVDVGNPLCAYTEERCERLAPLIEEIQELKKEHHAIILAHTYVHPDIIYGVADHVGDSYGLAKIAKATDAKTIVFPAVRFMAETAKILNPEKQVIDPNPNGGCSLAASIDGETVLELRKQYPEHVFVCYINTTADVKAACDVCITSSNVYKIIENIPSDKIFFLPDRLMGENLKNRMKSRGVEKEILVYPGTCYVHEQIEPEMVDFMKQQHRDAIVLAHPECKPEVVAKADVVGSTTDMYQYVKENREVKRPFLLLTECGVSSRLAVDVPEAKLIGGCMMCKYMRSNSLAAIRQALAAPRKGQIVEIEQQMQAKALRCIEQMFYYAEKTHAASS